MTLLCDVKTTRGDALRYKFSRTNRNAHRADAIIFVQQLDVGSEAWCKLLGWTEKYRIHPWIRRDERYNYDFCRFSTLQREGLIRPVISLKKLKERGV